MSSIRSRKYVVIGFAGLECAGSNGELLPSWALTGLGGE